MNKLIAFGMMVLGVLTGTLNAAEPVKIAKGEAAVVYFSWSSDGNTRFAAQTIAAKLGAQAFEIKPAKAYSGNYRNCLIESKPECYSKKLREIHPIEGLDLDKYKVIFIGTPNWWGTMAPPVSTAKPSACSRLTAEAVCSGSRRNSPNWCRIRTSCRPRRFSAVPLRRMSRNWKNSSPTGSR